MRRALLVIGFVAMVMAGMAQAPLQFHYQAVVRNDSNRIVRNTTVGVRTSILSEAHDVIYSEFRTAMTDGNGLLTLEVGSGEVETGIFNDIPWDDGKFFLQTEIDPEGGHDYTITLIDQLMSVPYAIYANHVANDFSGDYNDLDNLPTLFNGEWDSLRHKPNFAVVATTGSYNDLTGTPNLHAVATSGNYNDLENKPDLFSGSYNDLSNKPNLHAVATSGDYNVLENTPAIPTIPSNISSFNNDAGYLTNTQFSNIVSTVNQHLDSLAAAVQSSANCCAIPAGDAQPCPGTPTVTDTDNITYNTVKIGNQCWMKENLRVTHYADGTDIALGTSASSDIPYRYNPNNSAANVSTYGYLYNWAAVMYGASSSTLSPSGVQGPCPTGWHIPSDDEWTELTDYVAQYPIYRCVGNAADIAKSLASTTGWNSYSGNCVIGNDPSKNDHTGFSAMPAGYYDGSFHGFGQYANFWSTSEASSSAWYRYLDYNLSVVTRNSMSKSRGKSIRCVLGQGYNLAKLITTEASNINYTSATSGGNISHDGGASVTARGVCWSTSPNPTLSDSHTSDGTGMGGFTSTMNALSPNTTYYVRAYATNSMGTRYGEQITFTTLQQTPPSVTTNSISGITYNSATCSGNVTADGGAAVTARGICWSTSPEPTVSDSHTSNGTGTGGFSSTMTGLFPNTTYYVRAYATNGIGTAYGEQNTFTTFCNPMNITITGSTTILYNQSTTLTAAGANNYVWKTGNTTVGNTATITVSPTATTTYTVTGTNQYGCSGTKSTTVTVNPIRPTVTTNEITDINTTTATSGGNVTSNGGANVTARGICWSTSQNPTVSGNHTSEGTGTGEFTSTMTGLTPNTTYYVRAYATNSIGPNYGEQKTFTTTCNTVTITITGDTAINYGGSTTLTASGANNYVWKRNNTTVSTTANLTVNPTSTTTYSVTGTNQYGCTGTASVTVIVNAIMPTVTTSNVSNITATTATSGGNVTSAGGAAITARGICWSTNQSPTVDDAHTTNGTGTGTFTSTMNELTPNTTYYVRAYATNSAGTNYGDQKTLTTLCNTVNVTIAGNTTINYGDITTLTASGADNYVWKRNNTTVSTTADLSVNPTSTTTYSVTGTNQYGCTGTASVTVTVNAILPTVTTNNVSDIAATTATSGGNVTSDGGAAISARGICWSTNQNPTVDGAHTTNGTGTGTFTSAMNELTPNTTYYVRAYATNSAGTAYGEQKAFTTACNTVNVTIAGNTTISYGESTTLTASGANRYVWNDGNSEISTNASVTVNPTATTTYTVTGTNQYGCTGTASFTVTVNAILPTVTTNTVSDITTTTATSGGNITSDGGAAITARGICWSTSENPTMDGNHTTNGTGTGTFTSAMNELTPNTTYYVRAYATNSAGTAYGEQKAFTTACNTVNVTIAGNTTISYGESTTLTASGANRYVWSDGNSDIGTNTSVTVSPTATTTYTVTGTNQYGCTGTASFTITVNAILPTVTTNNVSNIADTTATSGGNVTSDGGAAITARGICWSTSQNPTVSDNHTTNGTGTGTYTSAMSELTPNTTYYVRAYATNSAGTAYGEQKAFTTECNTVTVSITGITTIDYGGSTTLTASGANSYDWSDGNSNISTNASVTVNPTSTTTYSVTGTNQYGCTGTKSTIVTVNAILPTVTTDNVSDVAATTATSGGNITSDGGAAITARGVCWSTSQNPTVSGSHTSDGTGTGTFSSEMTGLTPNTTYYVRAYATNSAGTEYGEQKTFKTECNTVTVSITGTTNISHGGSTTLTASGANSYEWKRGNTTIGTNASVTVNPTSTTTYTVIGTNLYGCKGTATVDVVVNALLPAITTYNVSNIGTSTATSGGNISSDGGSVVTARGVCWSTSQNPTVSDSHTSDGTGTGTFTSSITYLTPNTTYYVRAYATNSAGTAYGEQRTFTTECNTVTISITGNTTISYGGSTMLTSSGADSYVWKTGNTTVGNTATITVSPTATTTYTVTGTNQYGCTGTASVTIIVNAILPTVSTNNISDVATTTATSGGNISSDGGANVTARGICWSTSQNPTVSDNHTTNGTGSGTFTSSMTDLTPNTTFYVRAYATNSAGTAYGEQKTFTTLCNTVNVTIAGNTTISYGGSTTLTASGANNYVWSDGNSNIGTNASITVSPTATAVYFVTGTNQYGCTGTTSVTVTVNALLPTVTTNVVSNITYLTAEAGGNVTGDGGSTVTSRGICWSTSQNPTVSDDHTTNGSGTGSFTSAMTGLTPNTTYYVRAYATNSAGTAYGEQRTFTTECNTVTISITGNTTISYGGSTMLTASGADSYVWKTGNTTIGSTASITVNPTATTTYSVTGTNQYGCASSASVTVTVNAIPPTVSTSNVNNISTTTATCGGNVTSNGGAAVTARGICWSTSENPTMDGNHTTDGTGTGSFTSSITGLSPNTTYYVRAYATNSAGTAYGEQKTFKTVEEIIPTDIHIEGEELYCVGDDIILTAVSDKPGTFTWITWVGDRVGQTIHIPADQTLSSFPVSVTITTATGNTLTSDDKLITVNAAPQCMIMCLNMPMDGASQTP